jgi:hypothetical protein
MTADTLKIVKEDILRILGEEKKNYRRVHKIGG